MTTDVGADIPVRLAAFVVGVLVANWLAVEAYSSARAEGKGFYECLEVLKTAAEEGWKLTEQMIAKMGRASRLGERSRGVLDAGATSCYLIVNSIANSIQELLS